jgi:transmembrane sensor
MWLTRARMSHVRISRASMAMSLVAIGVLALGAVAWMTRGTFRHTTPSPARTYATAARQRATITLTDGSRVTLAPQTTLTVAGDFGRATRTVALRGEAYFEVTSASGAPFVVQSNDVRARVLGTAFSVRRYAGDRDTRIAVVTGKVAVNTVAGSRAAARRPAIVLSAGMVGIVTDSSAIAMSVRDLTPYTGWVDGQLVVRDAPVSQALAMLGDWYGFEFRLHDTTLATRHLTDTFDPDNPTEMLMALKAVLNVEMTFDGNVITVRPRRSAAPKARTRDTDRPLLTPPLQREVGRE